MPYSLHLAYALKFCELTTNILAALEAGTTPSNLEDSLFKFEKAFDYVINLELQLLRGISSVDSFRYRLETICSNIGFNLLTLCGECHLDVGDVNGLYGLHEAANQIPYQFCESRVEVLLLCAEFILNASRYLLVGFGKLLNHPSIAEEYFDETSTSWDIVNASFVLSSLPFAELPARIEEDWELIEFA